MLECVLLLVAAAANEAGKASVGNVIQTVWEQGIKSSFSLLVAILTAVFTYLLVTRRADRDKHELELRKEHEKNQLAIEKAGIESQLKQKEKEVEIVRSLAAEYDKDLRSRRIEAYSRLWKELEPFALYAPTGDLTYAALVPIGQRLRAWYFEDGGLLLSEKARDHYFALQDAVVELLKLPPEHWMRTLRAQSAQFTQMEVKEKQRGLPEKWKRGIDPELDFLELRRRTSTLRSSLCEDAGTREAPLMGMRPLDASKAGEPLNTPWPEPQPPSVTH